TGDDALGRARAVGVEHAHRNDARALGDAVLATRDRAGHVGAVTLLVVTVATAVDEVLAGLHAVAEVLVGGVDTGVDDVRGDVVGRGAVGVRVVQRQLGLVDAVQTPRRRRRLRLGGVHALVLHHVV